MYIAFVSSQGEREGGDARAHTHMATKGHEAMDRRVGARARADVGQKDYHKGRRDAKEDPGDWGKVDRRTA